MDMTLSARRCAVCHAGMPALTAAEIAPLLAQLDPGWAVAGESRLSRTYRLRDFLAAVDFVGRIAPVVEGEHVLASYQAASGREFADEELQVAWATSVWVACHTAAMEHLDGAPGQVTHQVMTDAPLRLHLAGC